MKRTAFLSAIVIAMTVLTPFGVKRAEAGTVGIGAMTWFSWWDPVWSSYNISGIGRTAEFVLNPGFFTGPAFSYTFDETTSLSAVFLYWKYNTSDIVPLPSSTYEFDRDVHKVESDIVVNFRINAMFKWFVGFKYQGYFYSETESFISGPVRLRLDRNAFFHNMGPGIGVGMTLHLFGPLYFLPNLSAITLFGYERTENVQFAYSLGGNVTASLAYYIEALHTTVILGYRYQQLFYLYHGNKRYKEFSSDRLHGVTFSFVVSL